MDDSQRIEKALEFAAQYGSIDGAHHKAWVVDQMVRSLTGCPMVAKVARDCRGDEYTYEAQGESQEYREFAARAGCWEIGIAP